MKDINPLNDLITLDNGFIVPKSLVNDSELINEPLSFVERMVHKYDKDEETIKENIKEQLGDKYPENEFNQIMNLLNSPMSDEEFNSLDFVEFNNNEIIELDELNKFDDEFNIYLNNEFDEDYTEEILALTYDVIFIEASKSLISFFSTLLSRFKFNYIDDEQDYLNDFDFNNDLSILYNQKYDETSNAFNRSTKRFNKIIKKYNKDKNRFSDIKVDFDKNIQLNADMEYIKETISLLEKYLSDIGYVKELTNKIITVDNNYDSYNDFKSVLKLVIMDYAI
jgi:hypothetical protein